MVWNDLGWVDTLIVMKAKSISGWSGVLTLTLFLLLSIYLLRLAVGTHGDHLEVSFLDVGQGDATLIETPKGAQVLIDGGAAGRVGRPLSRELPFYDRSLDMVIATHADADHIGGLVNVLREYRVDQVVMPARKSNTAGYEAYERVISDLPNETDVRTLTRGDVVQLPGEAYLLTLFPPAKHSPDDTNDSSLIFKLLYGETSWIFTGDSPAAIEQYLARSDGKLLGADVLKVGHHGSDTSSSNIFLSAVSPRVAVISAGADNPHGHPTETVLNRLQDTGADIFCTCKSGSIKLSTDGKKIIREQ